MPFPARSFTRPLIEAPGRRTISIGSLPRPSAPPTGSIRSRPDPPLGSSTEQPPLPSPRTSNHPPVPASRGDLSGRALDGPALFVHHPPEQGGAAHERHVLRHRLARGHRLPAPGDVTRVVRGYAECPGRQAADLVAAVLARAVPEE